jgi:catechol 2,3-dioxygenase-like lactoylglutathione lyase family enzyme
MITRLDHVVIGVRDLDEAMRAYQLLGFEVRQGGRHTGLRHAQRTHRFGLDYLELLAVYDTAQAMRSGGPGQFMSEYLRSQPVTMQRARADDGHVLSWPTSKRSERHGWASRCGA